MEGETITVTFGAQTFSPVQYHKFDVGPFSYTTVIQPGETIQEAYDRAYGWLRKLASQNFIQQRAEFYKYLPEAQKR
jgi:hypothetical protein